MTHQEIQDLAGHRAVSPWVMKLVADAVMKEREACIAICDELHKARAGDHNYFKFAANAIRELRAKQ
jgi:hypothetical protein